MMMYGTHPRACAGPGGDLAQAVRKARPTAWALRRRTRFIREAGGGRNGHPTSEIGGRNYPPAIAIRRPAASGTGRSAWEAFISASRAAISCGNAAVLFDVM